MAEISAADIVRAAAEVVETFPQGRYMTDDTEVSYFRDRCVHIEYETGGSGIEVYVLFDEGPELVLEVHRGEQMALREGRWKAHVVGLGGVCRVVFHGKRRRVRRSRGWCGTANSPDCEGYRADWSAHDC